MDALKVYNMHGEVVGSLTLKEDIRDVLMDEYLILGGVFNENKTRLLSYTVSPNPAIEGD